MRIFDRWGESVYKSNNKGESWDGLKNGVEAPIRTYMYMVSFIHAITGETIKAKGEVVLIR